MAFGAVGGFSGFGFSHPLHVFWVHPAATPATQLSGFACAD